MLIRNWKELAEIPNESDTHILEVNPKMCCAWLHTKHYKYYDNKLSFIDQIQNQDVYLSKLSFNGNKYKHSTKILQACGFDVELDNWDKE